MLGLVGVLTAAICSGCVDQQVPTGSRNPLVPAFAPDSIPRTLINTLALLTDQAGNKRRSELVVLSFHEGTSQAARQKAIAGVRGVVVGGKAGTQMEGWYIVRVPSATTVAAIDSVMSVLRSHAVGIVFPFTVGFPNDQSSPGPSDDANRTSADRVGGDLLTHAATSPGSLTAVPQLAVPATAPDSLPTSLINSLPLLTDESGNQHRSQLVLLSFRSGTPQPARQAAITRVGGVVIGGKAGIQMEGWYLVRVASATSMAAIDSVVRKLRANPSVELVGPFTLGFPDDESRQSVVPPMAPDSVPFSVISRLFYPANGGWPYAQDVLMLRFRLGTPVRERSRVIRLVSGTVIGGKRDVTAEGGIYVIGLPRDSTQATLLAARDVLRRENAVLTVWLYEFLPVDPTNRIPNDALDRSAQGPLVPPIAPDTIPRWLFDDSSLVANPDFPSGRFMRGVVSVLFKSEATLADRQAAVAAVGGVVIGGSRLLGTDGYYLIRLMSDTSVRAPFKAVKVLRGMGQVDDASVEWVSARLQRSERARRP